MLTKDQVLEMIAKAKSVKVGVDGLVDRCYFPISHDLARAKASEIAGFDLIVEFGSADIGCEDVLYIESVRRS